MTMRVLFVEDEVLIGGSVVDDLGDAGLEVVWKETAEAALDVLRKAEFDVLITDIRLPGIDGWQLSSIAREIQPRVRIIYVSGYPGEPRDIKNGVFVPKPYRTNDLIKLILGS